MDEWWRRCPVLSTQAIAALQRQMTSAIPIQQHLGEEVEGLDLSMDSVSNATQPGQLLGVLGRYSYRLAGVRPALGVNPA